MPDLFGFTRTTVKSRYALITPDSFVPSVFPGWKKVEAIINISPAMNGPRFAQMQITLNETSSGSGNTGALEHFYYVVEGKARLRAGSEEFDAKAGSIFFVERKVEHRFVDIEEDLVVVVFFSKLVPEGEKD